MVKEFYIDDECGIPTKDRTREDIELGVKFGNDIIQGKIDKTRADNYKNTLLNLGFKQVWRLPYWNFDISEVQDKISETENQIRKLQDEVKEYQSELQNKLEESENKKKNRCGWFDTESKKTYPFTTFCSDNIADYFK